MKIFLTLFKASFKSQTQYKFDFFVSTIGNILALFGDFLIIVFILLRFKNIDGWQLHEIALMYAIIELGFGFCRLFGEEFNKFETYILKGTFDTLLIRPVSPLIQMMLRKVDFKRIGMITQAAAVGIWGLSKCTFINNSIYLYLPFLIIASTLINFQVSLILASTAFWTGKNKDIIILGHYSTRTAAQYPASIYHNVFSFILTFIIPFFSINYYPLLYYTGKSDNIFYLMTPLLAIIVMTPISYIIWTSGIKKYSSAGT
ncbi:ABC transporter permease [Oceanirhabdus seepicola]|uniref:ABC-2 family transporter protein n=1 Tax=Oceanirhabdus seepicola TaxID=2828781 RepID=A0A9J6P8E2_9CLOT|nr:ABC-2 family transporter protein [Oceanirhabdus seepicola]MCM1992193.1 ABC-2 family transporter protein [Oceanirhabdus seepicola]